MLKVLQQVQRQSRNWPLPFLHRAMRTGGARSRKPCDSYPALPVATPLGYGERDCEECIWSSDMLWGKDVAPNGTIRRNEHALHVMLCGLGQSHRHSQASIEGWRLYLPFVLHGSHPGGTRSDIRKRSMPGSKQVAATNSLTAIVLRRCMLLHGVSNPISLG